MLNGKWKMGSRCYPHHSPLCGYERSNSVDDRPPMFDHQPKQQTSRVWGLSCPVWLLVAGFCAFIEFVAWFATDGFKFGFSWSEMSFVVAFAAIGLVALLNAIRLMWNAG
jgi:hypothetical protein